VTDPRTTGRRPADQPSIPHGEVLGSFESYADAQGVIARLAHTDFEVARLAIVGSGLTTVERVTGRMTYPRAAAAGAASGAWLGLFLGILLIVFSPSVEFGYVGAALLIGAGFGMIFGIVRHAATRRDRDFRSTHQIVATSYQVIVPSELLLRAQALLADAATDRDLPR
jgi:hypothetical protein